MLSAIPPNWSWASSASAARIIAGLPSAVSGVSHEISEGPDVPGSCHGSLIPDDRHLNANLDELMAYARNYTVNPTQVDRASETLMRVFPL